MYELLGYIKHFTSTKNYFDWIEKNKFAWNEKGLLFSASFSSSEIIFN